MKILNLFFLILLVSSCLHENPDHRKEIDYLLSFKLIKDPSPNPDKAVFNIHSSDKLNEVLLSEKWDSIRFSGGLFDTASYNQELIGIAKTEVQNELILGMHTLSFTSHTQAEMDSIASKTFEKVVLYVYHKNDIWELKPLGNN
jgi:hypothetical protein